MSLALSLCLTIAAIGLVARLCTLSAFGLAQTAVLCLLCAMPAAAQLSIHVRHRATPRRWLRLLLLLLLFFLAVALSALRGGSSASADLPPPGLFADSTSVSGWLAGEIVRRPGPARGGTRFSVRVDPGFHPELTDRVVSLWADSSAGVPRDGARIVAFAELSPPPPGHTPGGFDLSSWMSSRGVVATGVVRGRAWGETRAPSFHPRRALEDVREKWSRRLAAHVPGESGGFLRGLVLGERGRVEPEVIDDFQRAGVLHLLALSGQHVLLVAALLQFAFRWTGLRADGRTLFAVLGVWAYAVLTGASPSVTRASLGSTFHGVAAYLRRVPNGFEILGWSATVGLLLSPRLGAHVGFQLSCLASAGLILVASLHQSVEERVRARVLRLLWRVAVLPLATLGAQLAVLPLLGLHFGVVSGVSLVSNILVVPCCAVLLTIVLPLLVIDSFFAVPAFLWHSVAGLASVTLTLGESFAQLPGTRLACSLSAPQAGCALVLGVVAVVGVTHWWQSRGSIVPTRPAVVASAAGWVALGGWLAAVVLGFIPQPLRPESGAVYWMLDVGQGDAQVLELANGDVWIVDVGDRRPGFDAGARVLAPFLRARGHREVTGVVLTHEDRDHVGGWESLARDIPVREVVSGLETLSVLAERGELTRHRGPLRVVSQGDRLTSLPNGEFRVLWPPPGKTDLKPNDRSVVLELTIGGIRLVLPGDADSTQEIRWLDGLGGPIDILKLGHHGAASSSSCALLRRAEQGTALVSCGRRNRFGHPDSGALARAKNYRLSVRRTDLEGSVSIAIGARLETRKLLPDSIPQCGELW